MTYQITGHTRMGGLLGSPVAHSISPMMHNDSFRELGLDWVYLCFDVGPDRLGEVVNAFRSMNVYGFNLTMPDKEAVIPHLDELSLAAELIGAVNTVKNEDGKLIGHNTDGIGYIQSVSAVGWDIRGKEMTLLGAGGAACAIAVQAAIDGVSRLHLVSRRGRSWEKAGRLVEQINKKTGCQADLTDLADGSRLRRCLETSSLLTNATSVGMAPQADATPIPDTSMFHPGLLVSDVIYHPSKTRLLREAQRAGCPVCNGMYMLLYQGAAAFKIWTGQEMPVELIRERYFSRQDQGRISFRAEQLYTVCSRSCSAYASLSFSGIFKASMACSADQLVVLIRFLMAVQMPSFIPCSIPHSATPMLKSHISRTSSSNFLSITMENSSFKIFIFSPALIYGDRRTSSSLKMPNPSFSLLSPRHIMITSSKS